MEAPEPARSAQLQPGLVRHGRGTRAVPAAAVENEDGLDGSGDVGSCRGVDAAAMGASAGLQLVPDDPGAKLPAY